MTPFVSRTIVLTGLCGALGGVGEALVILTRYQLKRSFAEQLIFVAAGGLLESAICLFFFLCLFKLATSLLRSRVEGPHLAMGVFAAVIILYGGGLILNLPETDVLVGPMIPRKQVETRPDIMLVVIDTLRQDRLGCYGNNSIRTPGCDFFSRRSTLFTEAISQIPITAPSHASMFTGLYPAEHGSRYNGVSVKAQVPLLAEILAQHDYSPLAILSSAAVRGRMTGLDRGFILYDESYFFRQLDPAWQYVFPVKTLVRLLKLSPPERPAYQTNRRLMGCLPFLEQVSPWFLWLHYYDPHIPYEPPWPYDRMFDPEFRGTVHGDFQTLLAVHQGKMKLPPRDMMHLVSLYDGEVAAADRAFEQTIFTLLNSESADRLAILLTADHGESLLEHDYFFYHGENLYDPALIVPLLIMDPKVNHDKKPAIRQDPVLLLDIFPTILECAGLDHTPTRDAISLLSEPDHQGSSRPPRIALSENGTFFFLNQGNFDLHLDTKIYSLRTPTWKYISDPEAGETLFTLENDPQERENVLDRYPRWSAFFHTWLERAQRSFEQEQSPSQALTSDTIKELQSLGYLQQ